MSGKKIAALLLIIAGVALLIFGIYQFVEFRQSFGGKAASLGNQISKGLGGSTKVADGYIKPIALMIGGVIAGAAGFVLYRKR